MHSHLLFFLIPAAVLGEVFSAGVAATGPLCCTNGIPDDSQTCKKLGLNSYACESVRRNDEKAHPEDPGRKNGCDNKLLEGLFPFGRDVKAVVPRSTNTVELGPTSKGNTMFAFIGCAA
ncbi:hypothetical protein MGG_16703 [Pyricularia oryzae 70-15]|uniref:Hydrophobin n=1 Tax=Pyricularia oryzae (strain 70-15 / ATCC MYA-4617 / FGSC 8958) TaxID=242507 RepID=G4N3P0_PYRO7|nr:uncharacterized protein MGG_16703 [Pyricularia oryzae 70-15]EHA51864.1 hypothetical protein MGG_16703 [Pyricularia oryzae 70-15]KAI7911879.1 hypothetical protein M9X92_010330 [Pyricularia oryzae]KAI7912736.1 hypothetical protein M0657_010336 [Pyricularia oryzae]